jgi:sigma-B regulation protein RsbU (phosphoserine phosphatase)
MRRVDLFEAHPPIARLTGLLRESSAATEPADLLRILGPWFGGQGRYDLLVTVSKRNLPDGEYKITRVIDRPDRVEQLAQRINPWRDWTKTPTHRGGFLGRVIAEEQPQLYLDLDIADDPVLGVGVREMRSVLAIPNFDGGRALNWAFFFRRDPAGRSADQARRGVPEAEVMDDILRAIQDGNLLGLATKNLVATRRAEELNARLNQQLEAVAQVQRSLLPPRLPEIPGLDIRTSYLTSDEAGGDYYDFFPFPDGTLGVLIADVAGHGAAAATVMAMLRAILHCYESADTSPASVMRYCNARLIGARLEGSFVTAFFAVYDPRTGELRWARCGHNPPRLRRGDGSVQALDEAGTLPLGLMDDLPAAEGTSRLGVGDTLVLYTDGITEAFSPIDATHRREMFGLDRLDAALRECSGMPECVVDSIHAALFRHVRSMTRDDDQTLVVLQRTAETGSPA